MRTITTVASLLVCVQIVTMYPMEFTSYDDNEMDYPIVNSAFWNYNESCNTPTTTNLTNIFTTTTPLHLKVTYSGNNTIKYTLMPYTQYVPLWTPEVSRMSKRQSTFKAQKRATLNQLLQRLIALYGNEGIVFSGRSSHLRFGAGGR